MKKLSLLVALLLCVTIGGVYATWTYATDNDIYDAFSEAKVTITDATSAGANGVYKIESNLVLSIDQANDDHEAVLLFESTNTEDPYLKITFTPASYAPADIKENGVPSELYFGLTVPMQYTIDADGNYDADGTAVDIFVFANETNGIFEENVVWNKEADGSFTYTLDKTALQTQISLNHAELCGVNNAGGKLVLDTKAEHDAFRECLTGNIVARVTDGSIN